MCSAADPSHQWWGGVEHVLGGGRVAVEGWGRRARRAVDCTTNTGGRVCLQLRGVPGKEGEHCVTHAAIGGRRGQGLEMAGPQADAAPAARQKRGRCRGRRGDLGSRRCVGFCRWSEAGPHNYHRRVPHRHAAAACVASARVPPLLLQLLLLHRAAQPCRAAPSIQGDATRGMRRCERCLRAPSIPPTRSGSHQPCARCITASRSCAQAGPGPTCACGPGRRRATMDWAAQSGVPRAPQTACRAPCPVTRSLWG